MTQRICTFGDPVLRVKARPVEVVDDDIRQIADDMLKTMYAENGVGLAAEQVGRDISLCVIDIPPQGDVDEEGNRLNPDVQMPLVMINPEVVARSEETGAQEEGCLSFPGIYVPVVRPVEATVRYLDRSGAPCEVKAKALLARAMQHEIDHLNGVLFVDRVSQVKKIALSGRLKRLKKETQAALKDS